MSCIVHVVFRAFNKYCKYVLLVRLPAPYVVLLYLTQLNSHRRTYRTSNHNVQERPNRLFVILIDGGREIGGRHAALVVLFLGQSTLKGVEVAY